MTTLLAILTAEIVSMEVLALLSPFLLCCAAFGITLKPDGVFELFWNSNLVTSIADNG